MKSSGFLRKHTVLAFVNLVLCSVLLLPGLSLGADELDKGIQKALSLKNTGDYQEMVKNRIIRVLMPISKTFYFLDGAQQRGATYDVMMEFEKFINKKHKSKKHLKILVVVVPTNRDRLLPGIQEGLGDIAAGNLTITPERLKMVDFSDPVLKGVDEIVVTGPKSPKLETLEDLSGKTVHVRKSSSYYENLTRLNTAFKQKGKKPVKIAIMSEYLEDEDLLEMVAAGLLPMIVIDNHKAKLWVKVLKKITLHPEIKVNSGGEIGWAVRKNNPELQKVINEFVKGHKKGSLFGNIIFKRYFKNTKFIKNNVNEKEIKRFEDTLAIFQKYGKQYKFDWLMLAALAYQESTIDQSKRSHAGAVGVMQILPTTAKDKNVGIKDINKIEPNIHAGTKYIRFMADRYFNEPGVDELNRGLFAFASYNAGPARITRLRKEAAKSGLDPNVWFHNVEVIAAKRIGRETVQYVSNIFKYYTAYLHIVDQYQMKQVVKEIHSQ
jgi:membrane-bound lytic murein transglycosylase MltF